MKLKLYFLLILISFSANSQKNSEDFCHNDKIFNILMQDRDIKKEFQKYEKDLNNILLNINSKRIDAQTRIQIPVVVYVVHGGINTLSNISDQQVQSQITALNNYFSIYGIEFCLATKAGINSTSLPLRNPNTDIQNTPGIIHIENQNLTNHFFSDWPQLEFLASALITRSRYLRIWVVNSIENSTIKGYGMFPNASTFDGIVMKYDVFGEEQECQDCTLDSNFLNGKTLVHEVGHYLGLYHTFFEGCSENNTGDCTVLGDRICDTPPIENPNYACESINSCSQNNQMADTLNYMDYGNECSEHFTEEQTIRMHTVINNFRQNLVSTNNLKFTGACIGLNIVESNFTADKYSVCVGDTIPIVFKALSQPDVTYTWDFGDGTVTSTTSNETSHLYTSITNSPYNVQLTVNNPINGLESNTTKLIFVKNCTSINNENSNWFVGANSMLNFNSGVPSFNQLYTNSEIGSANATAIQSNNLGQMMFYTDKSNIYNSSFTNANPSHAVLQSGGYYLHTSNSVLILPRPGVQNQYYVFTNAYDENDNNNALHHGFRYSLVNSSGTISTSFKVPITNPTSLNFRTNSVDGALVGGSGITAIQKSNGYWLITSLRTVNDLHLLVIYELTNSGLTYKGSSAIPGILGNGTDCIIKASPNGNKIAVNYQNIYVYDFNKITGSIDSTPITIQNPLTFLPYGISFSPDSNIVYFNERYQKSLFQYNLKTLNNTAVKVADYNTLSNSTPGQIQIGPDNKLYVSKNDLSGELAVIHYPNNVLSINNPNACLFTLDGPTSLTSQINEELPNFVNARLNTAYDNSISFYPTGCNTFKFFPNISNTNNNTVFNWEFKNLSTNTIFNITGTNSCPIRTFTTGTYSIKVKIGSNIKASINNFIVTEMANPVILGSNFACSTLNQNSSNSVVLQNGESAQWSIIGGSGTISGLSNQPEVIIHWKTLPGTISLTVTNKDGCVKTTTKIIQSSCQTGANDYINVVKKRDNWNIYVAGNFTEYNGVVRNKIARLNSELTLDLTFNPGISANCTIEDLAIQNDGRIIIGGGFTEVSGQSKIGIARLLTSGLLDQTFIGTGVDGTVLAVQTSGSQIIAGGVFGSYNGDLSHNIVRINSDGSRDQSFDGASLVNLDLRVGCLSIQSDNKILIGGYSPVGDISLMMRLNANGTIDNTFTPFITSPFGNVSSIKILADGKILVGGDFFYNLGNTLYKGLIRLNSNGSVDSSFAPFSIGVTGNGSGIKEIDILDNGKIVITGGFSWLNNLSQRGIAILTPQGNLDTSFNCGDGLLHNPQPYPNSVSIGTGNSFVIIDSKLIVGGYFNMYDNILAGNIIKIDVNNNSIIGRSENSQDVSLVSEKRNSNTYDSGKTLNNLMVYPNPNNGNFNVKFKNAATDKVELNVYDMSGRTIFNKNYTSQGDFNENVQLSAVQSGVYLMTIFDGERTQVQRIIIK